MTPDLKQGTVASTTPSGDATRDALLQSGTDSEILPPPADPPSLQPQRLWGCFYLHPSFSPTNFVSFLLAAMFTVCFFVYLNASTGFVLTELLNFRTGEGEAAGALSFYDELVSMAAAAVWGALSDRIGRRIVYSTGFLIMGVALLLYPVATNLYPQLLLARLLFAIGGSACSSMLTAVLGDCAGKLRGRISGMLWAISPHG
jgi:MFS family permease